jgi:hypothetical protein
MLPNAPAPVDHAAVQRALASLTNTLGGIAKRIETRRSEEHAPPPEPTDDKRGEQEAAA